MTPQRTNRLAIAALILSLVAVVGSTTGLATAAKKALVPSTKPKAYGVLLLNKKRKFPASAIPTVARAKKADALSDKAAAALTGSCSPEAVDLGTWCLLASPYPVTNEEIGKNNYFWASQKCVELGGYLPTAAGSTAAGSEGVSDGSLGDPKQGQPNPTPLPANPQPQTLQYVTVYDNKDAGGFAGSKPVSQPENFRCGFDKLPGAADAGESTGSSTGGGTS